MESICATHPKLLSQKAFGTFPLATPTSVVLPLIYPVLLSSCPDCDFEESHLCGYSNQWNANVNWFVGGGGTQLFRNDIPDDHTYNNKSGEKCSGVKEGVSVCMSVCVLGEMQGPGKGLLTFPEDLQHEVSNTQLIKVFRLGINTVWRRN